MEGVPEELRSSCMARLAEEAPLEAVTTEHLLIGMEIFWILFELVMQLLLLTSVESESSLVQSYSG